MNRFVFCLVAGAYVVALGTAAHTQSPGDGPRYVNGMNLARPTDYREWVFVSSGLGMEYDPMPGAPPGQRFGNVFVNPASYRSFMKSGKWPDRTVFVLEFRASTSEGSINKAGRFQSQLVGLEAEVKDARFPDGWGFFNFSQKGTLRDSAEPLPVNAGCVDCHTKHTAVERTFVQFYPTLMDVARKMGTVKPGF